ncbi:MAG: PRC-barrel domain-containing protein [Candidatus Acidiferrales bacterium]
MLIEAQKLQGYKLESVDGEIGRFKEFYFDDRHWAIRYLIAETGGWLTGRQVLISPQTLGAVIKERQHISVNLTRKQIEDSPALYSDKPVSREFEEEYYGYLGLQPYWTGPYMWGDSPYIMRDRLNSKRPSPAEKVLDPHLRSTHDVRGHHIHAADGGIGHVDDFIIDDEIWAIRYLIIDTKNWWPGKKVLVSPRWIERISWSESKLFTNLSREAIKQAPEYTENSLLTRDYETSLHRHYDRPGYWLDEPVAKAHSR